MTVRMKQELIKMVIDLLESYIKVEEPTTQVSDDNAPIELLTIQECTQEINGLSEYTVRQLVAQGKIKYIRTGEGKRGKILITKQSLLDYFKLAG